MRRSRSRKRTTLRRMSGGSRRGGQDYRGTQTYQTDEPNAVKRDAAIYRRKGGFFSERRTR